MALFDQSYVVKDARGKELLRTPFKGSAIRRLADQTFIVTWQSLGQTVESAKDTRLKAETLADALVERGLEGVTLLPPRMLTVRNGKTIKLIERA
jgi:hypothetical protein